MKTVTKPLLGLTASDLMTETVVTIPQHMSVQGAARQLSHFGIRGAPVVDHDGRCIGVLSAFDYVSRCEHGDHPAGQRAGACCTHSAWEIHEGTSDVQEVRELMTADPVTATPATPLPELAQRMVDAHIHRIIVVDGDDRPMGIVSSTDILAAVARAAQMQENPALAER